MHVQPIVNTVRAALLDQARLAGADDAVAAAIEQLTDALDPALRLAAIELAEQAAGEVRAQRPEWPVDVVLLDGDPTLRITDMAASPDDRPTDEEFAARMTIRLPPTLKSTIEEAAGNAGDSVNTWVVDTLARNTRRARRGPRTRREGFDL